MSSIPSLEHFPLEVLYNILSFLDVHSLLQISRTSRLLRALSLDPLLQKSRLQQARLDLYFLLLHRIPKSSISPPNAWIWLSKTNVLSRSISKSLIRIRLSHSLERRPCVRELVDKAILPACCSYTRSSAVSLAIVSRQEAIRKLCLRDRLGRLLKRRPSIDRVVQLNIMPAECASGSLVSPKLVEARRRVIKEKLKDGLRAWVKGRAIEEQRRKEEEFDVRSANSMSVKAVVRKFSARRAVLEREESMHRVSLEKRRAQVQWGKDLELAKKREERQATMFGVYSQPNRANVLGLRKFWEGVVKAAAG